MEEAVRLTDAVEAPLDTACKLTSLLLINQECLKMQWINTFQDDSGSCSAVKE